MILPALGLFSYFVPFYGPLYLTGRYLANHEYFKPPETPQQKDYRIFLNEYVLKNPTMKVAYIILALMRLKHLIENSAQDLKNGIYDTTAAKRRQFPSYKLMTASERTQREAARIGYLFSLAAQITKYHLDGMALFTPSATDPVIIDLFMGLLPAMKNWTIPAKPDFEYLQAIKFPFAFTLPTLEEIFSKNRFFQPYQRETSDFANEPISGFAMPDPV